MGRRPKDIPQDHVNLAEAQKLLRVSKSQVYALRKKGLLAIFAEGHAPRAALLDLEIIPATELKHHGIGEQVVTEASRKNVMRRRDFYSLHQIEELRVFASALARAGEVNEEIERSLSGRVSAAAAYDFKAILHEYRREKLQPEDLPLWFWDREPCPSFEPPTGVFRYTAGETVANGGGRTYVLRSAGWVLENGQPHAEEEGLHNDRRPGRSGDTVLGRFDEGSPLPQYAVENAEYEDAEMRWQACYQRARRKLTRF